MFDAMLSGCDAYAMLGNDYYLLDPGVPLVFGDGTRVYGELAKKYVTHKTGYFILAPSGAGKTHFIRAQKELHWLDGDDLWPAAYAHPAGAWWLESLERMTEIDQRSDIITIEAKRLGFWILGASNAFLRPDAIVIPDWETHKRWIVVREREGYDGGATSDQLEQVMAHRKWILGWQENGTVPKFETVPEAVAYLVNRERRTPGRQSR